MRMKVHLTMHLAMYLKACKEMHSTSALEDFQDFWAHKLV